MDTPPRSAENGPAAVAAALPDALVHVDEWGSVVALDAAAEALFGRTSAEARGRPIDALLDGAEPIGPFFRSPGQARILGDHHVLYGRRPDGARVPVSAAAFKPAPGPGPGSVVVRGLGEPADPAPRACQPAGGARPAGGLDASLLRALLDHAPAAIFVKDAEGRYVVINGYMERWLRRSGGELLGRTDAEVLPPDVAEALGAHDRLAWTNRVAISFEERIPLPGGDRTYFATRCPVYDDQGRPIALCGVSFDVTPRIAAEARARRLAAIVESSDDAIVGKSLDGVVTSWNAGAERMYGYREDEVVGRPIFDFMPPEEVAVSRDRLARIARGERLAHVATRRQAKDGRWMDVSLKLSPIHGPDGQVVGVSAIERDVTAQRLAREEAAARAAEVEQARALAELKAHFVNAVSHELRSPLTAIFGYAELLEDQGEGPLTSDQALYVERLLTCARQLLRLVDDMLEAARLDAGTFHLRLAPADLARVVGEAVDLFAPQIADAGIQAVVDLAPAPRPVPLDAQRVTQVVSNLLANAIKFTPRGGRIAVRLAWDAAGGRCEVADSGPGIAPEDVPRLFERFGQLAAGRARGGTGLGLAICKAIVEAHGGTIGVSGGDGAGSTGSTFWFTLPYGPA